MRRGLIAALVLVAGCVTAKDSVGGGDARLDDSSPGKADAPEKKQGHACGPDAKGDIVILDARTGGALPCFEVSISSEPMSCSVNSECPSDRVYQGLTNSRGQVAVKAAFAGVRLVAVADGYSPSYALNATLNPQKVLELELAPEEGFWLKVLDPDGNYLQDVSIVFKQADAVVAQLRTNVLANVFFSQRQPFAGEPVSVEAAGFQPVTIAGVQDLGDDGHTLTLRK